MATEDYIHFASGVAILGNPESTIGIHALEVSSENLREIALVAEGLILNGAIGVIRYANPPEVRENLIKMEHTYKQSLLHMRTTVVRAYELESERLRSLNQMFSTVRPAPMLERIVYASLCHSRLHNITVRRMMGGFRPSPILSEIVQEERLARV